MDGSRVAGGELRFWHVGRVQSDVSQTRMRAANGAPAVLFSCFVCGGTAEAVGEQLVAPSAVTCRRVRGVSSWSRRRRVDLPVVSQSNTSDRAVIVADGDRYVWDGKLAVADLRQQSRLIVSA